MSGIVYKWRITDCKFAYLTDIYGGNPFITTQIQDDARISEVVKNLDEETYATKYEALCSIINADPDGRHIQMLDYKYYFNVDDTSCGLLQYAGTYYNGPQGEKGVGILRIQTIYEVGYTIIRFYLTDNTHYDAVIKNGISGVNGLNGDDGRDGETSNVILELESQKQDLENLREEILNEVTKELNDRLEWSQDALIDFAVQLSALTNDSGYITYVQNELLGFEEKMWGYIDKSACTKTEFYTVIAPYSGFMETIAEHMDALTSAVTKYNNRIDIAEGQLKEAMSYYDAVAGQLNEYWLKYDAVNNRLESVVSEMTGNSSVTLSEIFQTARMVGLMVSGPSGSTDINGNPLKAAIVAEINDTGSTISLSATKISMLGETVAEKLGSFDLTINGGNSYFASDGSGWIAKGGIMWDQLGNMRIDGQLGLGDVVSGLTELDLEFAGGTNASTIFNRDGSGWLAGGNIYWDKFGTMTIKKDVRIEGNLTVNEIISSLGQFTISFGEENQKAVTVFRDDGSGSLAGGAISWDPDGSVKIAGDLTVGGSIKQEVLDYANETNLPVGGSTTEFRSDGSGYICNGAIEWDVNGNMKIDGSVTIGGDEDIDEAIKAYLNTKDLLINNGMSRFNSDGSGWLANHSIEWNSAGTLTVKYLNTENANFPNGISLYDSDGNSLVNVNQNSIGKYDTFDNGISFWKYVSYSLNNATSWTFTTDMEAIGQYGPSQYISIDSLTLYESMTSDGTVYPTTATCTIQVNFYTSRTSSQPIQRTATINRADNYGRYSKTQSGFITAQLPSTIENNTVIYITYTVTNESTAQGGTLYASINANFNTISDKQVRIGCDGLYVNNGANNLTWIGSDKIVLRYNYSGLKYDTLSGSTSTANRVLQIGAGVISSINNTQISGGDKIADNYKVNWLPFYNYEPTFTVNSWKYGTIVNIGSSNKYYYEINPNSDCGSLYIDTPPFNSDFSFASECYILLPPSNWREGNMYNHPTPKGYKIKITNLTFGSSTCKVYVTCKPSEGQYHGAIIFGPNQTYNYVYNLNKCPMTYEFTYYGSYALGWSGLAIGNIDIWYVSGTASND